MAIIEVTHLTIQFVNPDGEEILKALTTLGEALMTTQAELAADLKAVNDQVAKIGTESSATLAKVAELEAALAAGGTVSAEVDAAMAALKAQVKVVDDLVADSAG